MEHSSYKSSFIIALLVNTVFILSFSYFFSFSSLLEKEKKELVIHLDMSQYELSVGNTPEKIKVQQEQQQGSQLLSGSDRESEPSANASPSLYTPYMGGVEAASVGVAGVSAVGSINGAIESEGTGSSRARDGGTSTGEESSTGGYVDVDNYLAKLNSMKTYPQQALRRNLEGSVHFLVTFDRSGNLVSYELTEGSYEVLNRAASALIERGGSIVNTTGEMQTVPITIHYNLQ